MHKDLDQTLSMDDQALSTNHDRQVIVYHCGAPKTGTTTLQAALLAMKSSLQGTGIYYMERNPFKGEKYLIHEAIIHANNGKVDVATQKAGQCYEAIFADASMHTVVVSNEGILGSPLTEQDPGLYPNALKQLDILQQMTAPRSFVIKFMIRNQASYLASYYTQRVRQGLTLSFDDYVQSFDLSALSWTDFIISLKKTHGEASVHVDCFEQFCTDQQATFYRLFPELSGHTLPVTTGHANKSPSASALGVMVFINRLLSFLFGPEENQLGTIRHSLQRACRRVLFPIAERLIPGEKLRVDPETKATLDALYASDLRRLDLEQ